MARLASCRYFLDKLTENMFSPSRKIRKLAIMVFSNFARGNDKIKKLVFLPSSLSVISQRFKESSGSE